MAQRLYGPTRARGDEQVKRLIALMLLLSMALVLSGCGPSEDAPENATPPPAEETLNPEPTPSPAPTPTPVPIVSPGDYQYEKLTNASLALGIMHPTHWEKVPGRQTISFVEPVSPWQMGARVAVTMKQVKKSPGNSGIRDQFTSFMNVLTEQMTDFAYDKDVKSNVKFMKHKAYSTTYTAAADDGTPIKGFVILTYVSKEKYFYAMNFSAPADRYDELEPVMQYIVTNCITLT